MCSTFWAFYSRIIEITSFINFLRFFFVFFGTIKTNMNHVCYTQFFATTCVPFFLFLFANIFFVFHFLFLFATALVR